MQTESLIDIRHTVKSGVPSLPYAKMAQTILGNDYSLSLVICGDVLSRRINRINRHKEYIPNVLSLPIDKKEGEIFLNIRKAAREARVAGVSVREQSAFLFIHGLLHLAGYQHGRTMEDAEQEYLRAFAIVK